MDQGTQGTEQVSERAEEVVEHKKKHKSKKDDKVVVMFKATGDAPLLRQNKFKINATEKFATVITFLAKQLHYTGTEKQLFVYVNSAFSPCPDMLMADLKKCYAIDKTLVLNYCTTAAWG